MVLFLFKWPLTYMWFHFMCYLPYITLYVGKWLFIPVDTHCAILSVRRTSIGLCRRVSMLSTFDNKRPHTHSLLVEHGADTTADNEEDKSVKIEQYSVNCALWVHTSKDTEWDLCTIQPSTGWLWLPIKLISTFRRTKVIKQQGKLQENEKDNH